MKLLCISNNKNNWSTRIICSGCGSLLEVDANDIYGTKCYFYNGESANCYSTVCPHCGRENDINSSNLPLDVIYKCDYTSCNSREKVLARYRNKSKRFRLF